MIRKYKKKNRFGVEYPPDNDPRWIVTQFPQTQDDAFNILPLGTIIHPSGYAFMTDWPKYNELRAQKELYLQQQAQIREQL
jgi:hypothetical protein